MTTKLTNPIKNSKLNTTLPNKIRTTLLKDDINIARADNRPRTTLRTRLLIMFIHSYRYPSHSVRPTQKPYHKTPLQTHETPDASQTKQ